MFKSDFSVTLPKASSDKLIVIANGPSLLKAFEKSPELFKTYPCIATNMFAIGKEFDLIKPLYYVWLDAYMWTSKSDNVIKVQQTLQRDVDWKMHLFVPQFSKGNAIIREIVKSNKNISLVYYNYTYFAGFPSIGHLLYKLNLSAPRAWNVTIMSLFLGINMKFKQLYLVGADHTWHEHLYMNNENVLHTKVEHFYDDQKSIEYVPFYKNGDSTMGTNTAKDFFWIWSKTFEGYEQVSAYAVNRNTYIFNASKESFIDAFKRRDLSEILK